MRKTKKFLTLCLSFALAAFLPAATAQKALADSPTTYCIYYDSSDDEWYYQSDTNTFNVDIEHKIASQIKDKIKNNDVLVVEGVSSSSGLNLDMSGISLSNLTINNASTVIIKTAGITDCYVLSGSQASISGNVANAYVYNNTHTNFNNNVSFMKLIGEDEVDSYVNVVGTVGHVIAEDDITVRFDCYNVAAGRLEVEDGTLRTDSAYYSSTPSGNTSSGSTASNNSSSGSSQQQQSSSASSSSGAYDEVPKTGEPVPVYVWLLSAAAVCFALKKYIERA